MHTDRIDTHGMMMMIVGALMSESQAEWVGNYVHEIRPKHQKVE